MQRAKGYLRKNDPMQASEKLYKVAEESVKYLAEINDLTEFQNAQREGKWNTPRLLSASQNLSNILNKPEIAQGWSNAYILHTVGFHENRLNNNEVAFYLPSVETLVGYVQEVEDARR